MSPLIEVSGANRTLPDGQRVLTSVRFVAKRGESVSIVGASGSGKSTLLACLGLISPFDAHATFRFDNHDIPRLSRSAVDRIRGRQIGFVLQNSELIEHLTALENTVAPFMHRADVSRREALILARDALGTVGLAGLERRRPLSLSGGERQRVAIARAIVTSPDLVLADEPTGALDARTGSEVIDHMLGLVDRLQTCLVIVTHDPAIAQRTNRQYRIEAGTIAEIRQ
jgi:putative ABC transport system ATP-binding protein